MKNKCHKAMAKCAMAITIECFNDDTPHILAICGAILANKATNEEIAEIADYLATFFEYEGKELRDELGGAD